MILVQPLPPPLPSPTSLVQRMEHLASSKVQQVYGKEGISEVASTLAKLAALKELPDGAPVTLFIDSPGGNVSLAEDIAGEMRRLNTYCYINFADSAAFEIIVPACKQRLVTVSSKLKFHDVQLNLEFMGLAPAFNEPISIRLLDEARSINDRLANNVREMIHPDNGCLLTKGNSFAMSFTRTVYYGKIKTRKNICVLLPLLLNLDFTAQQFIELTPNSKAFTMIPPDERLFPKEK